MSCFLKKGGKVSAAASGPAPRWGASRTDRSGNGDRFAACLLYTSLALLVLLSSEDAGHDLLFALLFLLL